MYGGADDDRDPPPREDERLLEEELAPMLAMEVKRGLMSDPPLCICLFAALDC